MLYYLYIYKHSCVHVFLKANAKNLMKYIWSHLNNVFLIEKFQNKNDCVVLN